MKLAIFGCGDFLRWQADALKQSRNVTVVALYDPDRSRAERFAESFGARVADDPDALLAASDVDAVALFVPPWVRRDLFVRAAEAGKHVIATKPLGSSVEDCEAMKAAAGANGIKAAIIYSRTGDAWVETVKDLLDEGRFGRLALYRQDWLHAYPKWNTWATDPERNGGPFMDAMIHNLNAARYLMGRPIEHSAFFSNKLAHPDLACADTECMVTQFKDGGVAHLFITWAADLATHSTQGNDREHIDLFYLITDQGWRLTKEWGDNGPVVVASREGKKETVPCAKSSQSHYDDFAAHVAGGDFPRTFSDLDAATEDIRLVRQQPTWS